MYKVLIVEDESAASRYQKRLIDQYCEGFCVSHIAVNGKEALEHLASSIPDLVISDVKMPVMDGIEFVNQLNHKYPGLPVVMISGYQDFEYVRKTLSTGVVDYLIKPVNPDVLVEVLMAQRNSIHQNKEAQRIVLLEKMVSLEQSSDTFPENPDDSEYFFLALFRQGGHHSRFHPKSLTGEGLMIKPGLYRVPGRDCKEWYYIGLEDMLNWKQFKRDVIIKTEQNSGITRSLAFCKKSVPLFEISQTCRKLILDIESHIVPGESVVCEEQQRADITIQWDQVIADRLDFALRENRWSQVLKTFDDLLDSWKRVKLPLMAAEASLRLYLLYLGRISKHSENQWNLSPAIEEALVDVDSYDQFHGEVLRLVKRACAIPENLTHSDDDLPIHFSDIWSWMQEQYAEPLTLDLVSHQYRISSSYLSKLFRKHLSMSFGEALTKTRINAAKRLIQSTPDMLLKDVANRSGFNDSYYFSKVFRSCEGLPPSDYARKYHKK